MTSLRSRLVLLLAILVAAASVVATSVAYAATDHQLSAQIDGSIERAAAQLIARPGTPGSPDGVGRGGAPARGAAPGSLPAPESGIAPPRPQGALGLVVAQELRRSGVVDARFSDVALPVTSTDRSIAASGGSSALRTEDVGGSSYRVVTIGLQGGGAVQVGQSLLPVEGVLGSLRWRLGLLGAFLVALASLVGWFVARRITGPLEQLTRTSELVATSGELDGEVPTSGRDEVGRLGRSFAAMLDALRRSKEQQHQLVRDAGHELRTPLTSMRSNIDLLIRHGSVLPPATVDRVLGDLDAEFRELSELVDEVVELATDSRASEPVEQVRVDELVEAAAARIGSRFGREVTVVAESWCVAGRSRALERALTNGMENAVKFSPDGSPIEVIAPRGSISVRDHGPGFDPVDGTRVLDRFYRSEAARGLPGSGLGLAIVCQIIDQHGGRVAVGNHPDGGAVLQIVLAETKGCGAWPGCEPLVADRAERPREG